MTQFILLFAAAVALFLDFFPKLQKRPKKESVVYAALLLSGTALAAVASLGVILPSPNDAIAFAIKALFSIN